MIELLEKTTQDSDSSEITETNTTTLIERYSVSTKDQQQVGRFVMDKYTMTYAGISDQPNGPHGPFDADK